MKRNQGSLANRVRHRPHLVGTLMLGALLGACGGGGGGGSGSSPSGNNASGCLNADLYTVGTEVEQLTRSPTTALRTQSAVMQQTHFNNVSDLTETQTLEETGLPQAPQLIYQTQTRQRYTRLSGKTLRTYGEVTTAPIGNDLALTDLLAGIGIPPLPDNVAPVITTIINEPALEQRFDLDPGDSYTQIYTQALDTSLSLLTEAVTIPLIRNSKQISAKTTYVGRETVTVPAGSFTACKFIDEVTTPGGTEVTTTWLAVGSGQFLKSQNNANVTIELVSASIDGVPVR